MVSREVSIMKLLHHPNVIKLYEVIDTELFLFLVMEYAAGGEVCLQIHYQNFDNYNQNSVAFRKLGRVFPLKKMFHSKKLFFYIVL